MAGGAEGEEDVTGEDINQLIAAPVETAGDAPRPLDAAEIPTDDAAAPTDEAVTPIGGLSHETRQRLIRQFERWLDRMDAGEAPPEGLPAELLADARQKSEGLESNHLPGLETDLFAVVSALTSLTGEVRLQGRAFKQLTDALAPLAQLPGRFERMEAAQHVVAEELARSADAAAEDDESNLPSSADVLGVLFDLRERLERGLRTFDQSSVALQCQALTCGWRQRLLGGKALSQQLLASTNTIREGYQLTLSRLEAAFQQWGVEQNGAAGEMFDPQTMNAMEVQAAPGQAEGTVLEVFRNGYSLDGRVLATAQVKVCKNPGKQQS